VHLSRSSLGTNPGDAGFVELLKVTTGVDPVSSPVLELSADGVESITT
jgi:hypothetical protein